MTRLVLGNVIGFIVTTCTEARTTHGSAGRRVSTAGRVSFGVLPPFAARVIKATQIGNTTSSDNHGSSAYGKEQDTEEVWVKLRAVAGGLILTQIIHGRKLFSKLTSVFFYMEMKHTSREA